MNLEKESFNDMFKNDGSIKVEDFLRRSCICHTLISSAFTNGSFETAIISPLFNDKHWIIVEKYKTIEGANKGHERWTNIFKDEDNLPREIFGFIRIINPLDKFSKFISGNFKSTDGIFEDEQRKCFKKNRKILLG